MIAEVEVEVVGVEGSRYWWNCFVFETREAFERMSPPLASDSNISRLPYARSEDLGAYSERQMVSQVLHLFSQDLFFTCRRFLKCFLLYLELFDNFTVCGCKL